MVPDWLRPLEVDGNLSDAESLDWSCSQVQQHVQVVSVAKGDRQSVSPGSPVPAAADAPAEGDSGEVETRWRFDVSASRPNPFLVNRHLGDQARSIIATSYGVLSIWQKKTHFFLGLSTQDVRCCA